MTVDYPTGEVPATPEYVLGVLRDMYSAYFEEGVLKAETPAIELAWAFNDLSWPRTRIIADGLNGTFDVKIPLSEWKVAFPGLRGRSVGEVCEFLAQRIARPMIRPWRSVAGDCLPAGVFLTVRSLLVRVGANPTSITPSGALGPHLRQLYDANKLWDFIHYLTRAAPGQMLCPQLDFGRLGKTATTTVGLGIVALFLGLLSLGFGAPLLGCGLFGLACLLMPVALLIGFLSGYRGPRRIELAGLPTFRDLAYRLAGQQPRRRIQPTP